MSLMTGLLLLVRTDPSLRYFAQIRSKTHSAPYLAHARYLWAGRVTESYLHITPRLRMPPYPLKSLWRRAQIPERLLHLLFNITNVRVYIYQQS